MSSFSFRSPIIRRAFGVMAAALVLALTSCAAEPAAAPSATPSSAPSGTHTPSPSVTPSPTPTPQSVADRVAAMSIRDRLASLLILHSAGTDPAAMRTFVEAYRPGGLIFMGDNVGAGITAVSAITDAVSEAVPLILAIDEEGGDVARLPEDVLPAGQDLAQAPVQNTTDAFSQRAKLLHEAGLNTNFGIVADITADADSFIFSRVLGTDPVSASDRVAAAVRAEASAGVLSTLKHFPGHGAAPGDSHSSLPRTDLDFARWQQAESRPFRAGIDAGAEVVMLGHLVYSSVDALPASLSPRWHDILRDELGFDGLIVSDDLGMLESSGDPAYADRVTNAVAALTSGTTMLVIVGDGPHPISPAALLDGLEAAVADGRLPLETVNSAAGLALAQRLSLAD
ncbi:glycoside hydrolase family 3 N-terminal domain-containing protein [Microbacterium sp. GXS0129]|uniref:glycoside hydrolase family 3 N-terminal domain-containing protein n=1 Tax=Microbacterium sp. GXS0129 TaxID=3377836 RepID=UPI00383BC937